MTPKPNKVPKQAADQSSTHRKNSSTSSTTEKERDAVIPTKDISPDDLEILE